MCRRRRSGHEDALHHEPAVRRRDASPSAPPSSTSIWPTCQIARLPSSTSPGETALSVVARRAGRAHGQRRGRCARHLDRPAEQRVLHGRACGCRPPAATALNVSVRRMLGAGRQLARVVGAGLGVGGAAGRHARLAAHVRDIHDDLDVGVLGRARRPDDRVEPHGAARVQRSPVCVRRPDREEARGLRRRIARRVVRAAAQCGRTVDPVRRRARANAGTSATRIGVAPCGRG